MNGLCAAVWIRYLPDILVGAFFLISIFISARRGFIGCVLGIVSSVLAFVLAVSLAGALVDGTGGLFGLEESLTKSFGKTFLKVDGFGVDVSQTGVKEALEAQKVSSVVSLLVVKVAGKQEQIAAGTTLASLLGQATGSLAARLLAGLVIFIGVKILIGLLKRVLSRVIDKIPVLGGVNRWLGALFGLLYAWIIVSAILAVLALIPGKAITAFFAKTVFVELLYEHNIVILLLGWFL